MQKTKSNLLLLAQRILLLVIFYSLCRLLFLVLNWNFFSDASFSSLINDLFFGIRFDLSAIVISNIFFIALHLLPFRIFYHSYYQLFLRVIFFVVNLPLLLFSCIDFGLFRFSARHATADAFKIMSFGEDFINTLPGMIVDFWYVLLIFIVLSFLLIKAYVRIGPARRRESEKVRQGESETDPRSTSLFLTFSLSLFKHIASIAFVVIAFRGGIQYKPVSIITASQYGNSKDVALILNTPFTLLKTFGKTYLNEVIYFSEDEAEKISPVVHSFGGTLPFRKLNVVLIILEGIGKEYIGSLNGYKGYTPFLDSLVKESLVFTNAFANGKRSIEGIPGIVAGIPSMMGEPFITSAYSGNSISSLANLLEKKGYATSFYHGGTNGTMGFDHFIHLAGFDSYYGRREYNNEKDFDGSWGIYDEPFLQNFAQQLNRMNQPFCSVVFTLSSHHPYSIPPSFKGQYNKGTLPIHESIQYTDFSLRKFFETSAGMPWFDSTLFVITSDHTALSELPFYQNKVGMYSVPILFYMRNAGLKGTSAVTTQHIDIIPGILDFLHFDEPFFSFGQSVFDTTADHFAVNYLNDSYQILSGQYSLSLDTLKNNFLCDYKTDSLLQHNLVKEQPQIATKLEKKLKAFIQNYNSALIKNRMVVGKQDQKANKK